MVRNAPNTCQCVLDYEWDAQAGFTVIRISNRTYERFLANPLHVAGIDPPVMEACQDHAHLRYLPTAEAGAAILRWQASLTEEEQAALLARHGAYVPVELG